VRRVAAAEVEALVQCAVREHLRDSAESGGRDLIRNHVVRVEVQADQLAVELKAEKAPSDPPNAVDNDRLVLRIPWKKTPMKRRRDIIVPASVSPHDRRPIRAETRATLVASIARGRRWLDEIVAGTVTGVEQIAARDKCSIRQVNMTISLAFLAPDLMKAAVEGRLPLVDLNLAVFMCNSVARQERVCRAQRPAAKIDALATSASGRDRTSAFEPAETPANCGLSLRDRETSVRIGLRGGPGRSPNFAARQRLTERCGRLGRFEAKRLFSLVPAPHDPTGPTGCGSSRPRCVRTVFPLRFPAAVRKPAAERG